MFKAGLKMDAFYNLLVSESLLEGATATAANEKGEVTTKFMEIENSKLAFEVAHSFSDSNTYFLSYLIRTIAELLVPILFSCYPADMLITNYFFYIGCHRSPNVAHGVRSAPSQEG